MHVWDMGVQKIWEDISSGAPDWWSRPSLRMLRHLGPAFCSIYVCVKQSVSFPCWFVGATGWWQRDGDVPLMENEVRATPVWWCNYIVRGHNQAWTWLFKAHSVRFHSLYLAHLWEAPLFPVESSQHERDCLWIGRQNFTGQGVLRKCQKFGGLFG